MISRHIIRRGVFNASFLMAGNVISQLIGTLAFFYIARKLGPQNVGIYATVVAFVGVFHVLTFNGLSKVLIREGAKKVNELSNILEKTSGTKFIFIVSAILICNIVSFLTGYDQQTRWLILLFSFVLLESGAYSFLGAIYQATENMKYLAYFSILSRITFALLSITFLILGYGVTFVILANLFSRFAVLAINFLCSRQYVRFNFNVSIKINKSVFRSGIVFTLIGFVNTLATKIDILMISFLSSPSNVGLYSVAYKITSEGEILRNTIAIAFFPIIINFFHKNNNSISLLRPSSYFFLGVLVICTFSSFFAKDILIFFFGEIYAESGRILRFLLFSLAFSYYTIPFTLTLQAKNCEKLLLVTSFCVALLNIPLNLLLFHQYGLIGIAYSTLIVYFTSALILTLLTHWALKVRC